jgi:tRNA (mo5U34)-methyltransferase
MTREDILDRINSREWLHRITLAPGIVTPGREDTSRKADLIAFPADFTGKTVLDVGTRDGYFSFEAERRGARHVVAYDQYLPYRAGFNIVKEILGSKVEHRLGSVYDISPATVGEFDVVLFLE